MLIGFRSCCDEVNGRESEWKVFFNQVANANRVFRRSVALIVTLIQFGALPHLIVSFFAFDCGQGGNRVTVFDTFGRLTASVAAKNETRRNI